ncbi:phage major capsid protein, partial [Herbiconiux daphne]
ETAVVNEDLSNVVDLGKQVIDQTNGIDNFVRKLINHIGKVTFQSRAYAGGVPSILMDSWEFGSILQKVSTELPDATENESWNLQDGQEYKQDIFTAPKVSAKFFNSKVTFEIPVSFTEMQVKESFSSAEQLNGFISMLTTAVENSMTVKLDSLIMRAINNMTAETLVAELGSGTAGAKTLDFTKSGVKAVNLLKLYNDTNPTNKVSVASAITNREFIRFATYQIALTSDRLTKIS